MQAIDKKHPIYDIKKYRRRADIMKALGHPIRLYFTEVLAGGERCVCDLTELVGVDISTVSRHLSVLKNAGLVADEKRGQMVFYRLTVPCVLNFFGCVESILDGAAQQD